MLRKLLGFREAEIVPSDNKVKNHRVVFMVGTEMQDSMTKPNRGDKLFQVTTLRVTGAEFNQLMHEASHYLLIRAAELKDKR